jgi:hypothetical protein
MKLREIKNARIKNNKRYRIKSSSERIAQFKRKNVMI